MKKYDFLPDMSEYPDCEEKRIVMNLAQKLEIKLEDMFSDKQKFDKYHREANEIYWELNAKMGTLCYKTRKDSFEKKKFVWPLIISIIAFVISLLTFISNLLIK